VPLILSWPGVLPEGTRVPSICNLVFWGDDDRRRPGCPAPNARNGRDLGAMASFIPRFVWMRKPSAIYVPDLSVALDRGDNGEIGIRMVRSGRWKMCIPKGTGDAFRSAGLTLPALRSVTAPIICRLAAAKLARRVLGRGLESAAIGPEVDGPLARKSVLKEIWAAGPAEKHGTVLIRG